MTNLPATLVDMQRQTCQRHGDRPFLGTKRADRWEWTSYAEFGDWVDRCTAALAALGLKSGDYVAIVSSNRVEWAVTAFALFRLGAAVVPMYEAQRPEEWQFILRDCNARAAFAGSRAVYETLTTVAGDLPNLEHVIGFDVPDDHEASWEALVTGGGASVETAEVDPDSTACLIYTSGTTGQPKGVILSHANIMFCVNVSPELFVAEPDERSLAFLPWAHVYGQAGELYVGMSQGVALAINDDIARLADNIVEVRPTVLLAVPRVFNAIYTAVQKQLAEKPRWVRGLVQAGVRASARRGRGESVALRQRMALWLSDRLVFSKVRGRFGGRLRYAISSAAALSPEVAQFMGALGIPVYEAYGMTESMYGTMTAPSQHRMGSVGKPWPGLRVEVDRSTVGRDGSEGEVVLHGPQVMRGYYNRPEENAEVFTPDGGLRTGDLGYFDEDGYLHITGRIKEQYKLENGKYVMPAPLEEQLKLSPYIANIFIYGANRPHNVALVVPDREAVGQWAEREGIELGETDTGGRVQDLMEAEVATYGSEFRGFDKPRRLAVVSEDFTVDNGLLTPTLKLKRRKVEAKYADLLDGLYGEEAAEAPAAEPTRADRAQAAN